MLSTMKVSATHTGVVRIGTLLKRSGCVANDVFGEALNVARRTDQLVGAVLVKQQQLRKSTLSYALYLQQLISQGVLDQEVATDALRLCNNSDITAEEALTRLGWEPKKESKLGLLLLNSGWLSPKLFETLTKESAELSVPLLLKGILTFRKLDEAFRALFFVKHHAVTMDRAANALSNYEKTHSSVWQCLAEGGHLPKNSNRIFLGELLTEGGIVKESDLLSCLEASFEKDEFLGAELVSRSLVTHDAINAAVKLQGLVNCDVISKAQAAQLLREMARKKIGLKQAISQSHIFDDNYGATTAVVLDFLRLAGIVSFDDVRQAIDATREYPLSSLPALLATGLVSKNVIEAAIALAEMVRHQVITKDVAITKLMLCERSGCSAKEALDFDYSSTEGQTSDEEPVVEVDELELQRLQIAQEKQKTRWVRLFCVVLGISLGTLVVGLFLGKAQREVLEYFAVAFIGAWVILFMSKLRRAQLLGHELDKLRIAGAARRPASPAPAFRSHCRQPKQSALPSFQGQV